MLRAGQSARRGPEQGDDLKGRLAAKEDGQGWCQPGRRRTRPEDSHSAEGQCTAADIPQRHPGGEGGTEIGEKAFGGTTILHECDGAVSRTIQSRCAIRGPGEQFTVD